MTPLDVGGFPLTDVSRLPNVTVAFPGEHWSDGKASELIVPGEAVVPVNSGGSLFVRRAFANESGSRRLAVALRTVQIPDIDGISPYYMPLGPNEIVNLALNVGDWVHRWTSGAFNLTLVSPDSYVPGDLIGWDPDAARPTGKPGTGAWIKAAREADAFAEVINWRPVNPSNEGILQVRSLKGQF